MKWAHSRKSCMGPTHTGMALGLISFQRGPYVVMLQSFNCSHCIGQTLYQCKPASWVTTSYRFHQLPQSSLRVGSDLVASVAVIRNLGIFIYADFWMRSHVTRTVSSCFAIPRQLRCIRRSVPRTVLQSLVSSLVIGRQSS